MHPLLPSPPTAGRSGNDHGEDEGSRESQRPPSHVLLELHGHTPRCYTVCIRGERGGMTLCRHRHRHSHGDRTWGVGASVLRYCEPLQGRSSEVLLIWFYSNVVPFTVKLFMMTFTPIVRRRCRRKFRDTSG